MADALKLIACYVSPAGNNKIAEWYERFSVQEKADMDAFIKNMRKAMDWKMPNYRPRLAGHKKLGELRWTSGKREHRLIGYLKQDTFYALMGCIHKGKIYDPADALDEAERRRARVETGTVRVTPYDI